MAQRKQLTWTELRVGLFVLVGLSVLAAGIFYVTGAGTIGPKYRLITYLPEVSGLANGAPVRLDGVEVGNVESIKLAPRTPGKPREKNKNIEVVMRVSKHNENDILTDSTANYDLPEPRRPPTEEEADPSTRRTASSISTRSCSPPRGCAT